MKLLSALKRATKMSNPMVPSIQNCCSLGCPQNYLLGLQLFAKADHGECDRTICFWPKLGTLWTWGIEKQLDMSTELPLLQPASNLKKVQPWVKPSQHKTIPWSSQRRLSLSESFAVGFVAHPTQERVGCMWLYYVGEKNVSEVWGYAVD